MRRFNSRSVYLQIIFMICLQAVCVTTYGQLIEVPNIEVITEKEGLPFNSISSLVKDKRGFIWIGSSEGLARYDGYSFLTIPLADGNTSIDNVLSLTIDQQGMIWIGHFGGYVSCVDPISLKTWNTKIEGRDESPIRTVFCDSKGDVYCFLDLIGLYRFDKTTKTFGFVAPLNHFPIRGLAAPYTYNRVSCMYEDPQHVFWVGTANGIYRYQPNDSTFQQMSPLNKDENRPAIINQLIPDGEDGFWCTTYGDGLIHYDTKKNDFVSYKFQEGYTGTSNIEYGVAKKSETEIWLATRGLGIGIFNTVSKKYSFYQKDSELGAGCSALLLDPTGLLWVVSDKGLMKWNIREAHFLFSKLYVSKSDNQAFYAIEKVVEDEATGRKLIGTSYADGLHLFEASGHETILPYEFHIKGEPYQITRDMLKDRDGNIYILSRDFLYKLTLDNRLVKVEGINKLLGRDQVPYYFKMVQTKNGDLWVCSSRNGLFHFDGKNWEHLSSQIPNTLAGNRIYGLIEDKLHRLWLAHSREGITVYDPQQKTFNYLKHDNKDSTSLVSNLFTDITQTSDGEIWVSSLEGLSIADGKQKELHFHNMTKVLPSKIIFSLITDTADNVWAASDKGLIRIEKNNHKLSTYNFKDGLQGNYDSYKLREGSKGSLLICKVQGYYSFDPLKLATQKTYSSPVYITSIKNHNTSLSFNSSDPIKIDYQSNSLSIEYTTLNYVNPLNNKYRYKIEGLDNDWTETSNHVVTYSGIPSGNYKFRVQLVGNTQTNEVTIGIVVATPFWKQIWFRFLLVATGMTGVYLVYRVRLNQIVQEEKLKTEFNIQLAEVEMKALKAQMSPHFIFNSLNSINRYIVKAEPEKASLYLTKFSKLIRLILDNSNNRTVSLNQELNAIKLYIELEMLRFDDRFSYNITVSKDLNPLSIGVPPMIIQPFVENAIWHGLLHKETRGQLDISISRYGSGLQCTITDDGIGRKKAMELKSKSVNKEKSYGMKITTDRLTMLNGESKV